MQLFFPAERVKLVFTMTRSLSLLSGDLSLLAGYNAGYRTVFFEAWPGSSDTALTVETSAS